MSCYAYLAKVFACQCSLRVPLPQADQLVDLPQFQIVRGAAEYGVRYFGCLRGIEGWEADTRRSNIMDRIDTGKVPP